MARSERLGSLRRLLARLPYSPLVLLACTTAVAHVVSWFTDLLPAPRSPFNVPRTAALPEKCPHRSLGQQAPLTMGRTQLWIRYPDPAQLQRSDKLGGLVHEYRLVA